uniref:Uncharacterized protein n=1 Tax=Onchocerca volvulus TaxID=6282 RepID=A0A8R1TVJ9_ONCVO
MLQRPRSRKNGSGMKDELKRTHSASNKNEDSNALPQEILDIAGATIWISIGHCITVLVSSSRFTEMISEYNTGRKDSTLRSETSSKAVPLSPSTLSLLPSFNLDV